MSKEEAEWGKLFISNFKLKSWLNHASCVFKFVQIKKKTRCKDIENCYCYTVLYFNLKKFKTFACHTQSYY